jgi:uncharacterized phage protein (TIGR01671 family)
VRTIKFRGKRIDNGDWVEGDLVHDYWISYNQTLKISIRYKIGDYYSFPIEIHPSTVGQFTGLIDKNGKEIYEGDVVEYESYPRNQNEQVSFSLYEAGFYPFTKPALGGYEWDYIDSKHCQIIGNIHDNPDLI